MGRRKGALNKTTKALKDMILGALSAVGGEKYLMEQARENPTAFLSLVGRILPSEMKLSGHVDFSNLTDADLERQIREDGFGVLPHAHRTNGANGNDRDHDLDRDLI